MFGFGIITNFTADIPTVVAIATGVAIATVLFGLIPTILVAPPTLVRARGGCLARACAAGGRGVRAKGWWEDSPGVGACAAIVYGSSTHPTVLATRVLLYSLGGRVR